MDPINDWIFVTFAKDYISFLIFRKKYKLKLSIFSKVLGMEMDPMNDWIFVPDLLYQGVSYLLINFRKMQMDDTND